jgi:hypothetical protein
MEKEKESKHMTIELQASASNATTKSTKDQISAKQRDWTGGKKRTEKRLPCYLNEAFYIPKFEEMDYDTVQVLQLQMVKP